MARVRAAIRPVLVILVVGVLMLSLLWSLQRWMIYYPDRSTPPPAAEVIPQARDLVLQTSDGLRLGAWLVHPTARDRRIAVLVAPGNAGNRLARAPLARALAGQGFTVLLPDYRGYGGNPSSPSESGLAQDIRAARTGLLHATGLTPDRVIYLGESLGAAVAAELAVAHPPAGLVLRSPFVDLAAVGREHIPFLPIRAMLGDRYSTAQHVAQVTAPTVVVYGTADTAVPPRQSRTVAEQAANLVRAVEVTGAEHNDLALVAGPDVVAAVVEIADRVDRGW